MSNPDLSKYVLDLNELDVLCGRGSGPNDRTGNIEFRNLILSRKAEYLAAKTREVKGRIASEVVNRVRQRGGRFLKKLTPAEVKDAGFKRGVNVYELADEPTVLEKAKQTLRQNRAAFEKQNRDDGQNEDGVQGMNPDFGALRTQFNEHASNFNTVMAMNMGMSSPGNSSGGSMNMNPIPLNQASYMLDSDKLPQMGSVDARHLQNTLFASSSISSKDLNSTNQMKLSMDLSALLGSMGSNLSGGSHTSNISAEEFGSLIKDFNDQDQASLIQQYKVLQDQQQQALMQQYAMMKQQHQNMMQNMYPQFSSGNSNGMNMNAQQGMNMNSSTHQMNFNGQNMTGQQNFSPQYQQNFPPQCTQQMFEFNNQSAGGSNMNMQQRESSASSVETSVMNNFSEDSLSRHHNTLNSDGFSSDVFHSLLRAYQPDHELQSQYENNHFQNSEMAKQTSNRSNEISQTSKESNTLSTISEFSQLSRDPVIAENLGSIARQQEFNDQQNSLLHSNLLAMKLVSMLTKNPIYPPVTMLVKNFKSITSRPGMMTELLSLPHIPSLHQCRNDHLASPKMVMQTSLLLLVLLLAKRLPRNSMTSQCNLQGPASDQACNPVLPLRINWARPLVIRLCFLSCQCQCPCLRFLMICPAIKTQVKVLPRGILLTRMVQFKRA
jgi:hypothetical protein